MTKDQIAAILLVAPYNISLEQQSQLTSRQISRICFPPRDDDGRPLNPDDVEQRRRMASEFGGASYISTEQQARQFYWSVWKDRGKDDAWIEAKWQEERAVKWAERSQRDKLDGRASRNKKKGPRNGQSRT